MTKILELHKISKSVPISYYDDGAAMLEAIACNTMAERIISQMIFIQRPEVVEDLWEDQLTNLRQQIREAQASALQESYDGAIYTSLTACLIAQSWINSFGEDNQITFTLEELARKVAHLSEGEILCIKRAANRVCPWMLKQSSRSKTGEFFTVKMLEK